MNAHCNLLYKLFSYKFGQEQRAPRTPRRSGQSEYEGGNVVSPWHRPLLTPGGIRPTNFCLSLSRSQDLSAVGRIKIMKNFNDPNED